MRKLAGLSSRARPPHPKPDNSGIKIDTNFDIRHDAGGKDADTHSATLRSYHRFLWSKELPVGGRFDLDASAPPQRRYLHNQTSAGEFFLASDNIIATYTFSSRAAPLISQISIREQDAFLRVGYTVGATTIFPGNKIDNKVTINGARGMNHLVGDRFDLTLECIRRHYVGEGNPLEVTLNRYSDFFSLFRDFQGYVDFFLLQDLVDPVGQVKYFAPFADFTTKPMPSDLDVYKTFRNRSVTFAHARNRRIASYVRSGGQ